jgi:hypothetical protein
LVRSQQLERTMKRVEPSSVIVIAGITAALSAATLGRSLAADFDRRGWKRAGRLAGHITGGLAK